MSSGRRRWLWIAIVAVLAAIWWLVPRGTSPSQAPAVVEPAEPPPAAERIAQPEEPTSDDEEPFAAPLPRDEVELPDTPAMPDAGVASDDPASLEEKRDQMLTAVLDRLRRDVSAAEEAGDDERAARLRVRIERLEQRQSELAEE